MTRRDECISARCGRIKAILKEWASRGDPAAAVRRRELVTDGRQPLLVECGCLRRDSILKSSWAMTLSPRRLAAGWLASWAPSGARSASASSLAWRGGAQGVAREHSDRGSAERREAAPRHARLASSSRAQRTQRLRRCSTRELRSPTLPRLQSLSSGACPRAIREIFRVKRFQILTV